MPDGVHWVIILLSSVLSAGSVGAVTAAIIKIMDRKHGHRREAAKDSQDANDRMFEMVKADIVDLRQRYHLRNNEYADLLRKYERMAGYMNYLCFLLKDKGITYKEWVEHGSQIDDHPEDRTWDGTKRREYGESASS